MKLSELAGGKGFRIVDGVDDVLIKVCRPTYQVSDNQHVTEQNAMIVSGPHTGILTYIEPFTEVEVIPGQ